MRIYGLTLFDQFSHVSSAWHGPCRSSGLGRRPLTAHAAKGFGNAQKGKTPAGDITPKLGSTLSAPADKAVRDAVASVERRKQRLAPPVDPNEASRGKLDVVQVRSWGSGEPSQLGELQVQSLSTEYSGKAQQGLPLYDLLGQELQLAQSQGLLAISGTPPPPFERWSFRRQRYLQYLADVGEVHAALEQGLEAIQACWGAQAAGAAGLAQLRLLARAAAAAADLEALQRALPGAAAGGGQETRGSDSSSCSAKQTARAHADYLKLLARDISSSSSSDSSCQAAAACCKLLAHTYALYVTHLTTGTRIGAAAAEKLQLFRHGALSLYQRFPPAAGDPLQCFVAGLNAAGQALSQQHVQQVVDELPRAFTKASLLLDALAHTD